MGNQRVHVACWKDAAGHVTASTVQSDQANAAVAYARDMSAALNDLKEFLRWQAKRHEWHERTELEDVEVRKLKLSVRPWHQHGESVLMLPTAVELRLPCVFGRLDRYNWLGSVPTLGISFVLHSAQGLHQIAEDRVRAALSNCSTAELVACTAVQDIELQQLSIPLAGENYRSLQRDDPTALAEVAHPLGKPVRRDKLETVFERDKEIEALTQHLIDNSASVLLLGEAGVGKSTILTHAARGLLKHDRQDSTQAAHRVWATNAGRLIAGMRYLGEWEQRCEAVIHELSALNGWLCVDSLHDLIQTGGQDARSSLAAFFLPYIQHGQLKVVCEATPDQLVAAERLLPEFVAALTKHSIDRLSDEQAESALAMTSQVIAQQHRVQFPDIVPATALQLVRRFEPYKPPLAPASQLLQRLAATARKARTEQVTLDSVYQAYAEKTGLRLDVLLDQLRLSHDDVVSHLESEVLGQPDACRAAATVVTTFKAGLNARGRPLGVLLFCGPTGVGKTQLAKTLGNYLFGESRSDTLVRLDMSEYGGPTSADRLLSKPDRSPSAWIQRVRLQPFCVLLLDEIEKAASEVFDVLMGLLDEGRLTDAYGRVTDFTSTIVIMTSNLGVSSGKGIGFGDTDAQRFEARVREFFRPEFFNRIDAVTAFQKLPLAICREIIQLEIAGLQSREGLARRAIQLAASDEVIEMLLKEGFDEALGARPLQRCLERHVTAPVARLLTRHPKLRDTSLQIQLDADSQTVVVPATKR